MRHHWYDKTVFVIAAVFNLSTAAILIFRPDFVLARFGISDPMAKWLARSLASSVATWGLAYALIVVNPVRFREFVRLGIVSKTFFFTIYAVAFFSNAIAFPAFIPALIDLVLALLFAEYWWRTRT